MKRYEITYRQARNFMENERAMVGWELIEVVDPKGDILIGVVHGHSSERFDAHLALLEFYTEEAK